MTTKSFWTSNKAVPTLVLIGAASYFLLIEHREHLFQWLPFLIIALCPLMHIFMHGGHGSHGGEHGAHAEEQGNQSDAEKSAFLRGVEEGKRQQDENRHH